MEAGAYADDVGIRVSQCCLRKARLQFLELAAAFFLSGNESTFIVQCWSLCIYSEVHCRNLRKVNIFTTYLFIEMFCDSENLLLPDHAPHLNYNQVPHKGKAEFWTSHFGPTCSQEREAVQNCHVSEVICFVFCHFCHRSTYESWHLLHVSVFSMLKYMEIYVEVLLSISEPLSLFLA
jgi:hypothetical protein